MSLSSFRKYIIRSLSSFRKYIICIIYMNKTLIPSHNSIKAFTYLHP